MGEAISTLYYLDLKFEVFDLTAGKIRMDWKRNAFLLQTD